MEQIKSNYFGGANFEARTVKDIIEPAKSISNQISVKAALDEMQARAIDSSPVIDQRGKLLGILSKNKMNRNVGGFGHDPKTEPVEAHIEKNNAYCFEDQTIAEAEQIMKLWIPGWSAMANGSVSPKGSWSRAKRSDTETAARRYRSFWACPRA
jgi:signal-transduction protein with cAMP-binding, CBS, and nucleotidyltransferase domain